MICGAHKGVFTGEAHPFQLEGKPVILCTECFEGFSQTNQDELIRVNEESERLRDAGEYTTGRVGRDRRRTTEQIEAQDDRNRQRGERRRLRAMERAEQDEDDRIRETQVGRVAPNREQLEDPLPQEYTRSHRSWSSEPYTRPNQPPVPFVDTEVTDTERAEQLARQTIFALTTGGIPADFPLVPVGSNQPDHRIQLAPVAGSTDRRVANHMIRIKAILREEEIIPDYPPFFATQTPQFIEDFFDTIYPGLTEAGHDERMRRFRSLIDHPNKDNPEFFKTYLENHINDAERTIRPPVYSKIHMFANGPHGELAAPNLIFDKASYLQIDPGNRLRFITYDTDNMELMRLFYRDINFGRSYIIKTFSPTVHGHHTSWYQYDDYVIDDGIWLTDSNGVDVIGLMILFNAPTTTIPEALIV
ncbi:hypothetical protein LCGC14_0267880 [marine sediment metagenome]|uniref:Uncharacterized protein n=1 Tax=marine sediment metagenome TaxID=412755 RepID=A0A0F9UGW9_9ZZZZ